MSIFSYVVPPLLEYPHPLLCIDLVLHRGWVNSPDLFYCTLEIVADLFNVYVKDANASVPPYPSTTHHLPQHHPTNVSNILMCIWITYIMPPKVIWSRANHYTSQRNLPFSPTRDKGLSKPEKGINRRRRLGIGKRNPRLDHKYR